MTIDLLRRLSGSTVAAVFAVAIAAGCSENQGPVGPTGTGGDVGPIPPSPLCGASDLSTGGGSAKGGVVTPTPAIFSPFQPQYGSTVAAAVPPPAISGGTLRILADGHTAVAADPDRDQVYIVDLSTKTVRATVVLNAGDEPGRVVADSAGRAHVALRRGGALVSIDTLTGEILQRRSVCAAPRGAAYDPATDVVHVACAGGELVSLPAAGGTAIRTVTLSRDLRDVVVDGPRLRVSRFLSAELLTVESDGSVSTTLRMPAFRATSARGGQRYTASTAWKMTEMPDGSGVMVLHQRGVDEEVQPVVGGYGGPDACNGIVHPAVTKVSSDGRTHSGPAMAGMVLAVDMAISRDAQRVAFISAGNATNMVPGDSGPDLTRVFVSDTGSVTDDQIGCMPDGMHGPCSAGFMGGTPVLAVDDPAGGTGAAGASGTTGTTPPDAMTGTGGASSVPPPEKPPVTCGVPDPSVPQTVGEPIAVAFDGAGQVVVQSREPAMLALPGTNNTIRLSAVSRKDTGHLVFHSNAGGFLACASCHAEGNDDGRVWNFACQGARRTQSLQAGGLRGSEPFHWDGLETDMTRLMTDVFQGRMSGPALAAEQIDGLMTWIDGQPRVPRAAPSDAAAVERGRALFNDSTRGACASCHAGATFTNNSTVDVGTGGAFQVPSLVGIGSRGPFMHDGCAKTLADRFSNTACGGANHGKISGLGASEIADLVTYLQSI
jgi:cytochrome c